MQVRLTVLGPRGGQALRSCDVLVTAPAGTALAAVAGGLAAAVAAAPETGDTGPRDGEGTGPAHPSASGPGAPGPSASSPGTSASCSVSSGSSGTSSSGASGSSSSGASGASGSSGSSGPAVFYAGAERLDARRCALGEPPLVDGAVLSLNAPVEPGSHPGVAQEPASDAAARLHVAAGPDAGGVHLLHGGRVRIGRSADADVPLDDPDVSRLHCAVTVADDGAVTVADLGSTNGTALDGAPVDARPRPFGPGAQLRIGESVLRLESAPPAARDEGPLARPPVFPGSLPTAPDGEGHLRILRRPPGPAATGGAASDPGVPHPGTSRSGTPYPDSPHPGTPCPDSSQSGPAQSGLSHPGLSHHPGSSPLAAGSGSSASGGPSGG
ncbi:FHA domain-containing protein, partial [Streptomyces lycii]